MTKMPQNKRTKPCFSLPRPFFLCCQPLLQFKPNRHARWSASVAQSALSRKQGVGRGKRVYHRWHTSPPSTVQPTPLCATVAPHPPRTMVCTSLVIRGSGREGNWYAAPESTVINGMSPGLAGARSTVPVAYYAFLLSPHFRHFFY